MPKNAERKRFGRLFWASLIVMITALIGLIYLAWWIMPKEVSEPLALPSPSVHVTTQEPTPSPTPSVPSLTPSPTSTATPSPSSPRLFPDPSGKPISLQVKRGSKDILGMNFAPRIIKGTKLTAECGKVALWDIPDAPLPGEASKYMSLVSGHMRCKPQVYSLDKLGTVKKGDLLIVTFSSGDQTVSRARDNVISVGKGQLNDEDNPENYTNTKVAQVTRLTTCDKTSKVRGDGHVENNLAVWFDRIA